MKDRKPRLADHVFAVISRHAEQNPYLRQVTRASLHSPDAVHVYLRGTEINQATRQLISNAQHEVLMQFYTFFHESDAGLDVKLALLELNKRAQPGIQIKIKIMVNDRRGPAAFFTRGTDDPFAWIGRDEAGAYILIKDDKHYVNNLDIQTKLHKHYFFDSYHTKQIIVDRKTLMLRSGDVHDKLNYIDGKEYWTELATTIHSGETAGAAAMSYDEHWMNGAGHLQKQYDLAKDEGIPILLLEKNESTDPFKRSGIQSPLKIAIIECLKRAEKSVKLITPNINDKDIAAEITAAVMRGIKVTIITGESYNDKRESNPGMGGTNRECMRKIRDNLPVEKWDDCEVMWANQRGMNPDEARQAMVHAKLMIIDDEVVITGSSPLDNQAMYNSAESDVLIEDKLVAAMYLEKVFKPILAQCDNNNQFQLKIAKYSLDHDIREAFASADKDEDQVVFIEALLSSIKCADSFIELAKILNTFCKESEVNPLVKVSVQGMFGRRTGVDALREISKEHHFQIRSAQ